MKIPEMIIDDPELGERTIPLNRWTPFIKDQLRLLEHYRDDGRAPSKQLLEDIEVYKYIIEHPQSEKMAEDYMNAMNDERERLKSYGISKMSVARKLGWFK